MAGVLRGIVERLTGIVLGITSNDSSITVTTNTNTGIVDLSVSGGSGGVSSIDGITGPITLIPGANITITDNSPSPGDITIAATGGGTGTVTAVSVASTNGFAGTSSGGATPSLTLSTSITGVLLGNGTAISASSVTNDVQTKAAIVPNTAPSAGQLLVGNAGGTAYAPVSASGDVTITSAGATAIGANKVTTTTINNAAVTYAKLQSESASTLLGNPTVSGATPSEITLGSGLAFSGTSLTVPTATTSNLGIVEPDGVTITVSGGVISAVSGGSGTVTTTGSPASGNLTKFSGSTAITNGDLSGDIATSGTLATTLATVNTNTGSFGSSTSIPNFTVNGKGLITAAGGNVVIAPAGTLTGTTLASNVVTSSLTTVATIGTGTWQGTKIGDAYGGTNADSSASTGVAQVNSGTWSFSTALANGTTATTQASSDNSTKVATTAYVTTGITNALNGLDWKPAVGYATTANVIGVNVAGVFTYTSTGVDTIDGRTLALNDVVLFKNQTTGADNGVWVVTTAGAIGVAGVLTRRSDYNTAAEIAPGDTFYVVGGTVNGNTSWVETAIVTTINTDPLAFSQVSGPGTYVAGTGLTLTGNSFSVNASQTQITAVGTVVTGTWSGLFGAVTGANLTNLTAANISAGTAGISVTGNSGTATALQNARTIGGVSFDGTANITVASATGGFTVSGGNLTTSANNIVTDTTTGTKIGTATTQKLGFYNATPIVQPTGNALTALSNLGIVGTPTLASSDVGLGNVTNDAQTKAGIVPNTAPSSGQILVGNAGGTAYAPVSASGAFTLASTGAATIATPGTLTVNTTNSTATAHTHAITSSSAPGAAASILATDASGIIGSTGTRIVKAWFVDLTVTNNIAGSITGNAATVTTNANLTGAITSSGNATSLGSFSSSNLLTALTDETGTGSAVFATSPTLVTPLLGTPTSGVLTNCTGTATGLTSGITNALKSATTTIDVSAATAPTSGQVLTASSGTAATWTTVSGTGTVTSVATDSTLSGGTITTTGTLGINLGNANTWTGIQTLNDSVIAVTTPVTTSTGYLGAPQNSQSTAYQFVLTDAGKHIYHPDADTTARTFTIPANGTVAFPIGTVIGIQNGNGAGVITLAITTDTLRWQASTGSRSIAANGTVTLLKVTSTVWRLTGDGIT